MSTGYLRRQAYHDTTARLGALIDPRLLVEGNFREAGGYTAMRELLALDVRDRPTAVFAVNDLAALGAFHAIAEAGLSAPRDISVVGFNDLFHATYITPQLTTMRVPDREMGTSAVQRLLAMILDDCWPEAPLLLTPTLIIRGSAAPPTAPL
jgi:LacI family transcriptional regulator